MLEYTDNKIMKLMGILFDKVNPYVISDCTNNLALAIYTQAHDIVLSM